MAPSLRALFLMVFRLYPLGCSVLCLTPMAVLFETNLIPYGMKVLVENLSRHPNSDASELTGVYMGLGIIGGAWIALVFSFRVYGWVQTRLIPKIQAELRMMFVDYMLGHSYSYFLNNLSGNISNKIMDLIRTFDAIREVCVWNIMVSGVVLSITFWMMWEIHPLFVGVFGTWCILHILFSFWSAQRMNISSRSNAEDKSQLFLIIFVVFGINSCQNGKLTLSPTVAILPAILLAFLWKPRAFNKNLEVFMSGVGHNNILLMCFVFLLSGAFSEVMASIGGISATVNFALYYIPHHCILPGVFIVSSFISLAMGTSMGTVASVTPIAVGICQTAGVDLSIGIGAVLGGAMFCDNLSIISDTTIAAVQTQGCEMKDKFKMNFIIAIPAMIASVALLWTYPQTWTIDSDLDFDFIKVLPYLIVLLLSVTGLHVYLILTIGIVLGGLVGLISADYSFVTYSQAIYKGFSVMEEILILSMFIGGLSELIKHQGGMTYLIEKILLLSHKFNHQGKPNKKIGELSIAAMSSIADICTANNTVSILMAGEATRDIAKRYDILPTRAASLLDIFACVFQGILPYSAQVLLAAMISGLSGGKPVSV